MEKKTWPPMANLVSDWMKNHLRYH